MFYKVLRFVLQIIFGILFRPKILGKENVPMTGGMIMAANHLSNWDPPMVGTYMPRPVAYMAKEELFKTVLHDGALPRKTFSMGEAHDKRFYMESRKIK